MCCKEFNLAQRGLESILPNKNVFVYLGVSSHKDSVTMGFSVGALGHMILAQPPQEPEIEVSQSDSQPGARDQ